jgi:hypothetical protein
MDDRGKGDRRLTELVEATRPCIERSRFCSTENRRAAAGKESKDQVGPPDLL